MPTVCKMPAIQCKIDPSEYKTLLENGHESNICFLLHKQGDNRNASLRIPAHFDILINSGNEEMYKILHGYPDKRMFYVDANARGFKNLLRVLYDEKVKISSMITALESLQTAIDFKCSKLAELSVEKIDFYLSSNTVLQVLKVIGFCETQSQITNSPEITRILNDLRKNCCILIDYEIKSLLQNEEMEELTRDQIELILSRNSLQNIKEKDIWEFLDRWVINECQRLSCECTNSMKREILGFTGKMVRFSLMKKKDYLAGPAPVFTSDENDEIFRQMKNNEKLYRNTKVEKMVPLSERSLKTNKRRRRNSDDDENKDSVWFCLLRGLICIFD